MLIAAACFVQFSAAAADSVAPAWVCVQKDGHKAIQDSPCRSDQQVQRNLQVVEHTQTIQDVFADLGRSNMEHSMAMQCNLHRQNLASIADANRTELNKSLGAMQRNEAIQNRDYIAQNCTPFGR